MAGSIALTAFLLGWVLRGFPARSKVRRFRNALHQSKGAVPQLEGEVRNRDRQIERLQMEMKDLQARLRDADIAASSKSKELREVQRESRLLHTELAAAKKIQQDDGFLLEGFDDGEEEAITDPVALQRLAQADAMYQALRTTLGEREEEIAQLKSKVLSPAAGQPEQDDSADGGNHDVDELEERLRDRDSTIEIMEQQLMELRQDRDMYANLVNTRANKTNGADLLERVTSLERELDLRNTAISDREEKLKRLLKELEQKSADYDRLKQDLTRFVEGSKESDETQQEYENQVGVLLKEVDYLRSEMDARQRELSDLRHQLEQSESWLTKFKSAAAKRGEELAVMTAQRDELQRTLETKAH